MSRLALVAKATNEVLQIIGEGGRFERMDIDPPIRVDCAPAGWDNEAYRVEAVTDFAAPVGKQVTGSPSYTSSDGVTVEVFAVEDIPPPAPEPSPAEKLAAAGLSLADLKALLAEIS